MTEVVPRTPPPPPPHAPSPAPPASRDRGVMAEHESVRPSGPPIELNAFQILMRRWSKLHPYNAGQVMQVSGSGDREQWKQAVEAVVQELGLGKPRFGHAEHSVRYLPVGEVPIEQTDRGLEAFFNEELNRPFAAGDLPIRFCILPGPEVNGGPSHYLAAVYDHWIADSRAMRELMQRLFERYRLGETAGERLPPLELHAPTFRKLFGRHVNGLTRLAAMRESLRNIWDHRKAYRLNLWVPMDFNSRFVHRQLPEGLIERLYRFAKARGASVNDLFIAIIGQAMGAYTAEDRLGRPVKPLHFSRRQIGIGTIVDIRDAASESLDRVFGLYLSSYTVLLDNPEQRPAGEITKQVAAHTGRIKKNMGTVKSFFGLMIARFWYDMYDSPRFRATLLHKTVPVVAGISNVNMTNSWVDAERAQKGAAAVSGHAGAVPMNGSAGKNGNPGVCEAGTGGERPQVLDYLRISPTGPLIPLVFTLTTIRNRLSLCVTYRTTSFHEEKLQGVVEDFVRRLEAVAAEETR